MRVLRRYTFKLYPNAAQTAALVERSRMLASLWNALLQMREDHYRRECQMVGAWETREYIDKKGKPRVAKKRKTLTERDHYKDITALRAECEEWRALPVAMARGTAFALNEAFKAFFRRLMAGEAEAGYPQYRKVVRGAPIMFNEPSGSGWLFYRAPDYAPGPDQNGRAARAEKAQGGWRLYIKSVPGEIKARGRLPVTPLAWKTGTVMFRDGAWWLSIVVECERERAAGDERIKITFDLIDEFARVERVDGGAPAASKEEITPHLQGVKSDPGQGTPQTGGGETITDPPYGVGLGQGTPQTGGGETRPSPWGAWAGGQDTSQTECGETEASTGRSTNQVLAICLRADAIKSARDIRFGTWETNKKGEKVLSKRFRKSRRWLRETRRAGRLTTKAARIRKNNAHLWSNAMIRLAADIVVHTPKIKEATKSPRGDKQSWGANVESVSGLNRHILNFTPAFAASALKYKAEEAGIGCEVIIDEAPKVAVGGDLVTAGKTIRRAKRAIRKEAA